MTRKVLKFWWIPLGVVLAMFFVTFLSGCDAYECPADSKPREAIILSKLSREKSRDFFVSNIVATLDGVRWQTKYIVGNVGESIMILPSQIKDTQRCNHVAGGHRWLNPLGPIQSLDRLYELQARNAIAKEPNQ